MKTQREDALAQQNNVVEVWPKVLVSADEHNSQQDSLSLFGPCCTDGCQYCRPNCHEQTDSSNYL